MFKNKISKFARRQFSSIYSRNEVSPMISSLFSGILYSSIIISYIERESLYITLQNEEMIERVKNLKKVE